MSHHALLRVAAVAAVWLLATGCAQSDLDADPAETPSSAATATPAASLSAATNEGGGRPEREPDDGEAAEDDQDEAEEPLVATGDCAAYRNSGDWCVNDIGDYDCEGGTGNGPNYAPRDVDVIKPGVDPFDLDRNSDGEGCEGPAPADPAPPPPPEDPGTDPRFDTCGEAIANGYGPYYAGEPEYDWYRDADSDGVVCE